MHGLERGLSVASKAAGSGYFSCNRTRSECQEWRGVSILCVNDMLLVRHREVPNVPFIQLDKDTLEQINSDQPFTCEDDLLNW